MPSSVHYLLDFGNQSWISLPSVPADLSPIKFITGNNASGVIIAGGVNVTKLAYIANYNSSSWIRLPDAPSAVLGLAGDTQYGAIVAHDSNAVSYIADFRSNEWEQIGQRAPWPISSVCGNNSTGVVVAGGAESAGNLRVAYCGDYRNPQWHTLPDAPWNIKGISGNNTSGVVAFGGDAGRQVAYMPNFQSPSWVSLADAPFDATAIAGENTAGAIIVGGTQVRYMGSYAVNEWTEIESRINPIADVAGNNTRGAIVVENT